MEGKMKRTGILWFGLIVIVLIALLVALGCDTGRAIRTITLSLIHI